MNPIYLFDGRNGEYLISDLAEKLIAGWYEGGSDGSLGPDAGDYSLDPVYSGQFWEIEVEDPVTGDAWAMTAWDGINVKWGLGRPATLTINTIGETASDVAYVERRSDLVVYRGGVPYFRGRIMQVNDSLTDRGHQIQLSATDYAGMLDHRFLQPDDRPTKIYEEVPEKVVEWEPTTQWKAGTQVKDPEEQFPNQVYEAKIDVPDSRPSEWSMTKEYSRNLDDSEKNADLVTYQGSVYECVKEIEKISEWSATTSYEINDRCVEDGIIYRAIGDSDAPDWGDGDPVPGYADRCYPKGFFVYWQPDLEIGDGNVRERKGIYRARRDTKAHEKPGANMNAGDGVAYENGSNDAWYYHNDASPCDLYFQSRPYPGEELKPGLGCGEKDDDGNNPNPRNDDVEAVQSVVGAEDFSYPPFPGVNVEQRQQGEHVVAVQIAVGAEPVDGDYGPVTEAAVQEWEKDNELPEDGIVDANDWKVMFTDEPGCFGPATEQAVKVWKSANGFPDDDAVIDNVVWEAMFADQETVENCEQDGEKWVAKNDWYFQGTYVVHRGEVYYASKDIRATDRIEVPGEDATGRKNPDIPRDPKAPDELSGQQAGWVRFALKGTNRNHIPSESKNYWKVEANWPEPGSDTTFWKNLNLKRPKLDTGNWKVVPTPFRMVRQYEQVGQFDMAWDLIDMTQKKLSGDMGIVRAQGAPGNGGDDDGLPAPSAKPGRKRDRIFEDVSTTVSELVTECGSTVDGFDWWVDAERQWWAQTPMRWRDRTQHLALVYGSTVHSIKRGSSYSFFSSVTVEGDRKETVPDTFETESPIHGRWEVTERLSDVKKQSAVRERGDQYLASAGFESSFWQMDLAPYVYERADIQIGDVCAFQVDFPPRLDLTGLVRIVDIVVKVTGSGEVKVSVGCETVAMSEDQNGATPANGIQFRRIDEIDSLGDTIQRLATRIRRAR